MRREAVGIARRDDGIAMITVIGVMLVITVLAIGSFQIARQSLFDASRAEDETRAFRAASAGIDSVLAAFTPGEADHWDFSTPDGSATVDLSPVPNSPGEFQLVSQGTGLDGSTERVAQRFFYLNLWEMNFAGTGSQSLMSGSSGMNGSSNIYGPFYMKGSMAVEANMSVKEGPVFINGGNFITKTAASVVGDDSQSVRLYCDGTVNVDKGDVHILGPFRAVPEVVLPKMTLKDLQDAATLSRKESGDNFMGGKDGPHGYPPNLETDTWAGAYYKYFGPGGGLVTQSLGGGGTPLVLGAGSFGSWGAVESSTTGIALPAATAASGSVVLGGPYASSTYYNVHDDFAYWDENTSDWDILYISGTVYVDGPVTFTDNVMYVGNGTIVANGPVTFKGRFRPFSWTTAIGEVNAFGERMKYASGVATPESITLEGNSANSAGEDDPIRTYPFDYAGAFYTDKKLIVPQPLTSLRGSILSDQMEFASPNTDLVTNPLLPSYLPDSLPGSEGGLITPGPWTRL